MDFKFTPEDESFRQELRTFLETELPGTWEGGGRYPEEDDWDLTRVIRRRMADRGWLTMHWPEEYGGQGPSPVKSAIFNEEIAYLRAPGRDIFGVRMLGPTLMIHGSEEQKRTHLPPVARGEVQWCQGYSEPESGSDLASLSTRAVRDGDDLVINGGKIWTTLAHRADWIMLLTRTDPDAPKHRGISFVLVDMKSPGVTVRPIINMAGGHEFNQVLFDNVRVPRANVVGEEDRGWYVAVTLLDFERSGIDYSANARRLLDDVREYATDTRRNGQSLMEVPWVRSLMADRYIECEVARLIAYNVAYMQGQGLVPTTGSLHEQGLRQRDRASCHRGGNGRAGAVRHLRPGREMGAAAGPGAGTLDAQFLRDHRGGHFRSTAEHNRRPWAGAAARLICNRLQGV